MKKYIFELRNGAWCQFDRSIFSDLEKKYEQVYLQTRLIEPKSRVLYLLRRVHFSKKANKLVELPFKKIWYSLKLIPWDCDNEYYIIFIDTIAPIDKEFLKDLSRKYLVHYILLLLNSCIPPYSNALKQSVEALKFDYIFTFDKDDSEKYGFVFTDNIYSKLRMNISAEPKYDLYYIGGNNGRFSRALEVFISSKSAGVKQLYRITGVGESDKKFEKDIIYNQFINYSESVDELMTANCILELERENDNRNCATTRYYEAVCYNKKLLTNNKNVVNLPFYNPDYMHVFEKPEDIDWEWVKERIPVDYHYDGRFSPTHLIDKIIELEEERERQANAEKEAH